MEKVSHCKLLMIHQVNIFASECVLFIVGCSTEIMSAKVVGSRHIIWCHPAGKCHSLYWHISAINLAFISVNSFWHLESGLKSKKKWLTHFYLMYQIDHQKKRLCVSRSKCNFVHYAFKTSCSFCIHWQVRWNLTSTLCCLCLFLYIKFYHDYVSWVIHSLNVA